MAERKPLVLIGGRIREIPAADTIPAANAPAGGSTVAVYVDQTPDNGTYGTLAGAVNGSNAVFTVSQGSYLSGTLQVYINGQLQTQGATNDYQETTPNSGTFTFVAAPISGEVVTAVYQKAVVNLAGGNLSGALNEFEGAPIASASTTDIGAAGGNFVIITGSATITALGTAQAGSRRLLRFTGQPTLTHNATSLILPGALNFVPNIEDLIEFTSEGSGNWRMTGYFPTLQSPPSFYGQLMARMAGNIMF